MTYNDLHQKFSTLRTSPLRPDTLVAAKKKALSKRVEASSLGSDQLLIFSNWRNEASADEKLEEISRFLSKAIELLNTMLPPEVRDVLEAGGLMSKYLEKRVGEEGFGVFFDNFRLYFQLISKSEDIEARDKALALFPPKRDSEYACLGGMANQLEEACRVLRPETRLSACFDEFLAESIVAHHLTSDVRPANQIHLPKLLASKLGVPGSVISSLDRYYLSPIRGVPAWKFFEIYLAFTSMDIEHRYSLAEIRESLSATFEVLKKEDVQPDDVKLLRSQPIFGLLEEAFGPIDLNSAEYQEIVDTDDGNYMVQFRAEGFIHLIDRLVDPASQIEHDAFSDVFLEDGSTKLAQDLAESEDPKVLERSIVKLGILADDFKGSSPITFSWVIYKMGCILEPGTKDPLSVGQAKLQKMKANKDQLSLIGDQWIEKCLDRFEAFENGDQLESRFMQCLRSDKIGLAHHMIDHKPFVLFFQKSFCTLKERVPNFLWEYQMSDLLGSNLQSRLDFVMSSARFLPLKGGNLDLKDAFTESFLKTLDKTLVWGTREDLFLNALDQNNLPIARYIATKNLLKDLPYSGSDQLGKALLNGEIEKVEVLLKTGAATVVAQHQNPWCQAISGGHLECVKALIKAGHSPKGKWIHDENPITIAARHGQKAILEYFLTYDVRLGEQKERSPVGASLRGGHIEVMQLLLEKGADANALHLGKLPLVQALERGKEEAVDLLLASGADVNLRDRSGKRPLFSAIRSDNPDLIEKVLKAGASPIKLDQGKRSILGSIDETTPDRIVQMLVEALPPEIRPEIQVSLEKKHFQNADRRLTQWIWSQYPQAKRVRMTLGRAKKYVNWLVK